MNSIEKIVARSLRVVSRGFERVQSGDFVCIRPRHVLTHDNTAPVLSKFLAMVGDNPSVFDRCQPVVCLDHDIQNQSASNLHKYALIQRFCEQQGIDFYPAGTGVGHQVLVEQGYTRPGELVVASDSHANMYGGVGCLGTPLVRSDAAAIWATGLTWWKVPPVARVNLRHRLRPGRTAKDLILTLCQRVRTLLNHAVEFHGPGVATLSIDQRLTLANMTTEWGAIAGLFPIDERLLHWYSVRQPHEFDQDANIRLARALQPDHDAHYNVEIDLDLDSVSAVVAGPDTIAGRTQTVAQVARDRVRVDKAYLVSCANARVEDIEQAAAVLRGRRLAQHVQLYVAAASRQVQSQVEASGAWKVFEDVGAVLLPSGCGPCIGMGAGLLQPGEIGISASNRNFPGRMGSPKARTYLASPAIVAASAIEGYIAAPDSWPQEKEDRDVQIEIRCQRKQASSRPRVPLIAGFPRMMQGSIVLCPNDQISTDGIYPGKYTYRDELSPKDQAAVVMENYDPSFASLVANHSDLILVAGHQFGCGSSREQAATALRHAGIQLILTASLSCTFQRNAFNNGFLALECPGLMEFLQSQGRSQSSHVRSRLLPIEARIDFEDWLVQVDSSTFPIHPIGQQVQEIVMASLDGWVKAQRQRL